MTPLAGRHTLGPDSGTLQVFTYREGVAQKVGHDLVLEVERWEATVEVGPEGTLSAVRLEVDPDSLAVRQGLHGVKPLSERDRSEISRNIDEKVLRRRPIVFESAAVDHVDGRLSVSGQLTMAGTTRPATFELSTSEDGRVEAKLGLAQSSWGITPYRGLMGALKVRDTVEVVVSVRLPVD
jgi:polyisoprenoid-binding protein YceI